MTNLLSKRQRVDGKLVSRAVLSCAVSLSVDPHTGAVLVDKQPGELVEHKANFKAFFFRTFVILFLVLYS